MRALRTFVDEVYAPGLHMAFAAAWFLALQGTLVLSEGPGRAWRLDGGVLAGILTVFLALFFLRVLDEWKDLEYDRVHNPERPLVRGAVRHRDLTVFLAVTATSVLALNMWMSPTLALLVAVDLAWGVCLVGLERISRRVRDGMLLNLLVTYPVNVALSVYTYALLLERQGASPTGRGLLIVAAFALAFLNYEVSRKTAWSHFAEPGERLYSRSLGGRGAILLAFGCAATATLLVFLVAGGPAPLAWLVLLPLTPAVLGLLRFVGERRQRVRLTPHALAFLLLFYVSLGVQAFAADLVILAAPVSGLSAFRAEVFVPQDAPIYDPSQASSAHPG